MYLEIYQQIVIHEIIFLELETFYWITKFIYNICILYNAICIASWILLIKFNNVDKCEINYQNKYNGVVIYILEKYLRQNEK